MKPTTYEFTEVFKDRYGNQKAQRVYMQIKHRFQKFSLLKYYPMRESNSTREARLHEMNAAKIAVPKVPYEPSDVYFRKFSLLKYYHMRESNSTLPAKLKL